MEVFALAGQNLLSPIVLSFVLGFATALARSDLTIPEAVAKGLSIYLLFAIGIKGGVGVAESGLSPLVISSLVAGFVLSAAFPFLAFALLRVLSRLSVTDAAAVAGHYGSISLVTFVAMTSVLDGQGVPFEGHMVAVAAVMEAPAILSALFIASTRGAGRKISGELLHEVMLNSSIVLLVGSFIIGWVTGPAGLERIEAFVVSPFQGVLCLFLLDMGLLAGRGIRESRGTRSGGLAIFGCVMPLVGGAIGLGTGWLLGLSTGGIALLTTLCASASYIAVPAAMRVALPEANPSVYLTLSLGITFPFNLTAGLAIYFALARMIGG